MHRDESWMSIQICPCTISPCTISMHYLYALSQTIFTDKHICTDIFQIYTYINRYWPGKPKHEQIHTDMLWAWHLWQGWRAGIGQPPLLHQLLGHDLAHRPCHSSCLTRLHLFCSVWFSKDNPFQLALHALSALLLCLAILECCLIYTYMNRYRHIYTDMNRYAQICTDRTPIRSYKLQKYEQI